MRDRFRAWNRPEVQYAPVAVINHFWHDLYQPELFFHSFKPITNYDPGSEAIYVFKRITPLITNQGRAS